MKTFGAMLVFVMALSIAACVPPPPVDVDVSVPLPPPIVFSGPPEMVVLPDTDVYVVPYYDQDIYFYGGWWWRPWGSRWYRSLYYDSGWEFYHGVPGWYGGVHPHWRDNYRNHMWGGHRWDYRPVPYGDVRTNWKRWQSSGYWRDQKNRGTTGSYHHGVETRRDFRGFAQEPGGKQAPATTRQVPAEARRKQEPAATRQAPDLSKNKSAFGGVGRGGEAQKQSNRGSQSRQSMSSKGARGGGKGNAGRGSGSDSRSKGDVGRPR